MGKSTIPIYGVDENGKPVFSPELSEALQSIALSRENKVITLEIKWPDRATVKLPLPPLAGAFFELMPTFDSQTDTMRTIQEQIQRKWQGERKTSGSLMTAAEIVYAVQEATQRWTWKSAHFKPLSLD